MKKMKWNINCSIIISVLRKWYGQLCSIETKQIILLFNNLHYILKIHRLLFLILTKPTTSTLCAGLRKQGSGMMDSHLLVVSGVSSWWPHGCSEAEMNPGDVSVSAHTTFRLFSNGYHNKNN